MQWAGTVESMARLGGTAARAEALLGVGVVSTTPVSGGDVSTATRLRLRDGRSAIIKTRADSPTDFFSTEAIGLRWLAEADGPPIPEVLAVDHDCIIVAWVEPGKPSREAAEDLGRSLATLHRAGAGQFGAPQEGFIAMAPLPNKAAPSWPEFYASRRVMPYVRAAVDRHTLTVEDARTIESLMRRVGEFAGDPEPPSRIHGDLWSGNVVWGADGAAHLIDPAAHGGHRETDLAMLSLFGAPHLERIIDSYDEASPLAEGWLSRVALHHIHPLLVHAMLFGGGYGARAGAAARSILDGTSERRP